MPSLDTRKDRRYTYGEYKTWTDEARWELIEGTAHCMSPTPSVKHQRISANLFLQLSSFLEGKPCEVFYSPFDVLLPENEVSEDSIDTVVQPDLVIICDKSKITEKGCKGAPDIVIEISSPRTGAKDKITKLNLYEKHGVKEYWIADQSDNTVMVFALEKGRYGKPKIFNSDAVLVSSVIQGLEIALKSVFPAYSGQT